MMSVVYLLKYHNIEVSVCDLLLDSTPSKVAGDYFLICNCQIKSQRELIPPPVYITPFPPPSMVATYVQYSILLNGSLMASSSGF